ncbi:tetratricopeptide repeat protein [uncultured Cyclobacterium sp.]|uniref:tetratricopeptide repeat protein n=1 Tax=uncultured Cyclobacterium sp. TaxID=453820 RepID=UPI0030ECDEFD
MEKEKAIAFNNEGAKHFLNQAFEKAAACYKIAYELDPENTSILNNMGLYFHQQKDYDKAIIYFEKAINITLKPHFLINLGNVLSMKGEYTLAWNQFSKASELFPEHQNAKISLAKLATHIEDLDKAVQLWQEIIKAHPSDQNNIQLVRVFMKMKHWEKAIHTLSTMDSDSWSGETWFLAGQCEFQLKNYGLAVKSFKSALAEGPDNTSFRHYLALTYLAMGNVDEGLDHLLKNARLDPENPAILTDVAVVYLSKGNVQTAANWLEKALNLAPDFEKALHYKSQMKQINSSHQVQN